MAPIETARDISGMNDWEKKASIEPTRRQSYGDIQQMNSQHTRARIEHAGNLFLWIEEMVKMCLQIGKHPQRPERADTVDFLILLLPSNSSANVNFLLHTVTIHI